MRYRLAVVLALTAFGAVQCTDANEPQPVLIVSTGAASFAAVAGGADPAVATITVGNGGAGTLSGIAVSTAYGAGQPTGWLTATLSGTTAPATLTLRAALGSLPPAAYAATVSVNATGADNGPIAVPVTFTVNAGGVTTLSVNALSLGGLQGVGVPDSAIVLVTNGGAGALRDLTVRVNYLLGPGSWLTTTLSDTEVPAELQLQPSNTLSPGVYTADVFVESPYATNAPSVSVTYTVQAAIADIMVEEPDTIDIGTIEAGRTVQLPAWTVINRGTVASNAVRVAWHLSTDSLFTAADPQLGNALITIPLVPSGGRSGLAQFVLFPRSLPAGVYWIGLVADVLDQTVESNEANNVKRTRFTVTAAPEIGLNRDSLTYRILAGGEDARLDTITISNVGGGSLGAIAWGMNYTPGQPENWLAGLMYGAYSPPTFLEVGLHISVRDLPPGRYTGEVQITAFEAGISRLVPVTLIVDPAIAVDRPYIGLDAVQDAPSPAPQTVAVTGVNGPIGGLAAAVTYDAGEPTGWLTAALSGTTTPATLGLTWATSTLPAGRYHATVAVASPEAGNSPRTVRVELTVAAPPPAIVLSPDIVSLSTQAGAAPTVRTVAVTNGGGGTLDQLAVQSINYGIGQTTTGWLTATLDQTTPPATLTLSATTAALLPSQPYSASVIIGSPTAASSASVSVTLSVSPAIVVAPTTVTFAGVAGGPNPAAQQVNVTSLVGGVIGSLGHTVTYGAGQPTGWLAAGFSATETPAVLGLQATTAGLSAGTYTASVVVIGNAANSPQAVAVTFTVTQPVLPPAAPSSLVATAVSGSRIDLSWVDNGSNEDGFLIERCTNNATFACIDFLGDPANFGQIATVASNVTTYQNASVSAGTNYVYRVRAANAAGASAYSNEASATATVAAPSNLVATAVSLSQINLTWTDQSSDETGFQLERCIGAGCTTFTVIATLGANSTSFLDAGLGEATPHSYRVRATGGTGSAYSNVATVSTFAATTLPAVPSSLVATVVSGNEIDLTWIDNASNEAGYRLERCNGAGCTTFAEVASVAAGVTAYDNTGLSGSTVYRYRVRAWNSVGNSAYSAIVTATTLTTPPAPSGLVATAISSGQITLTWVDNSTIETGFRVERCQGATCTNFTLNLSLGANLTTGTSSSLTSNTTYRFRVYALNANGVSAFSNIATDTTPVLEPPTGLTVTVLSSGRIRVDWTNHAPVFATSQVEVHRCAGVACAAFAVVADLDGDIATLTNTGLTPATSYSYRARATRATVSSAFSNTATAVTNVAPGTPTNLTGSSLASGSVSLAWVDNAVAGTSLQIERCAGEACSNFALLISVAASGEAYTNTSLGGATTYRYRVRTTDGDNFSPYSNIVTVTTQPAAGAPATPSGLAANAVSSSQVNLTWVDNASNETGYQVERCAGVGCTVFAAIVTANAVNVTSFQNTGLSSLTSYSYRVRMMNAAGNSLYSNVVTVTTPVLAAPTGLSGTVISSTQINLSWFDNSSGESGFRIERCTGTGAGCTPFVLIVSVGANVVTYQSTGLTAGTTYTYRVRAFDSGGTSAYTNLISIGTPTDP